MDFASDLNTMLFVFTIFFGLVAGGYFLAIKTLTPKANDYLLCLVGLPLLASVLMGVAILLATVAPALLAIVGGVAVVFVIAKRIKSRKIEIARNNALDSVLADDNVL